MEPEVRLAVDNYGRSGWTHLEAVGFLCGAVLRLMAAPLSALSATTPSQSREGRLGAEFYHLEQFQRAVPLLRDAAEKGETAACIFLARCFQEGLGGLSPNPSEVARLVQGVTIADPYLKGCCAYYGLTGAVNHPEAVVCFREGAEQGLMTAQYALGHCYYEGYGVDGDTKEGVSWITKAAKQGFAKAQRAMGICNENGHGWAKGPGEATGHAFVWYRQAAYQGDLPSLFAKQRIAGPAAIKSPNSSN